MASSESGKRKRVSSRDAEDDEEDSLEEEADEMEEQAADANDEWARAVASAYLAVVSV